MFMELFLQVIMAVFGLFFGPLRIYKQFLNNLCLVCVVVSWSFIDVTSASCGGRLSDASGDIKTPNYPNKSPNLVNCKWEIVAPKYDKILLTFTVFDVEAGTSALLCDKDYVEILDGSRSLGRYCNDELKYPRGTISSKSNSLTVIYRTNAFSSKTSSLFHATYERQPCGDFLTGEKGEISSPNYPGPYPAPKHCSWTIEVPKDRVIRFYFLHFELDPASKCNLDFIRAFDGFNASSRLIGHFCADRLPPKEIRSTSNAMRLDFHSFRPTASTGFHGFYEAENHCGGYLRGNSGSFSTPGYGHPLYLTAIQECKWTIEVPKGNIISAVFTSFDVRSSPKCSVNYVDIFNGPDEKSRSLGRYCGNKVINPPTVRSSGNTMVIKIHRTSLSGNGFFVTYTAIDPKNPYDRCSEGSGGLLFKCNNNNRIQCQWKCDGTDDCGDNSDEKNCAINGSTNKKKDKLTSYVILLVSITGSAVVIALVIFIVDRFRKKRRSQASRRRRRRRARLRALDPDSGEPTSPPPTYDFAVSVSSCCDTTSNPPTYDESITPPASSEYVTESSTLPTETEISGNAEEITSTDNHSQVDTDTEMNGMDASDRVEIISLGESPPSNDTSPLIV